MPRGRHDNVGTTFGRVAPNKIWDGKNVQNLARFLETFACDRKYLRNGSVYCVSKICKALDQLNFILYIRPKISLTWNSYWPTQVDFFGKLHFGPYGVLPPSNFYTPFNALNCIFIRTWVARRPQVGLCPIFLVLCKVHEICSAELNLGKVIRIVDTSCHIRRLKYTNSISAKALPQTQPGEAYSAPRML